MFVDLLYLCCVGTQRSLFISVILSFLSGCVSVVLSVKGLICILLSVSTSEKGLKCRGPLIITSLLDLEDLENC